MELSSFPAQRRERAIAAKYLLILTTYWSMSSREYLAMAFENSPRRQEGGTSGSEVATRAIELGMDPSKDKNLLWIAEQSLKAKLTDGWAEYVDDNGNVYYYNDQTGESCWDHPALASFKQLYLKMKAQVSATPEKLPDSARSKITNTTRNSTLTDYLSHKQSWDDMPPAIPQYAVSQVPAYASELSDELDFWRKKCEDLEAQNHRLNEESRMVKVGLIDCEDTLRSITAEVRQFLLKADFSCKVVGGSDGGVVAAIADSESSSRACLNALSSLLRDMKDLERRAVDAEGQQAIWTKREAELKADFHAMERTLLATIDKKKSVIYMMEDDLSGLQADVDRLRGERNDLRDMLDEQRAGDTSYDIIATKLDASYAKTQELQREQSALKDELLTAKLRVKELMDEKSAAAMQVREGQEELEIEKTRSAKLSSENAALELELLAVQKELRRADLAQHEASEIASSEKEMGLQDSRRREQELESDLVKRGHELEMAQATIVALQERLEDQRSTEQLLTAKLEGSSDRSMALQDRIADLIEKVSKRESDIINLQQENELVKAQLSDALHTCNRAAVDQTRDRESLEVLLCDKESLEQTVKRLEDDSRGSSNRYKSLKDLFDKCVADLEDAQSRISTLKSDLEASRSLKEELRHEKERSSGLESEVEKKCHELAVAQTKILGLQERLEDQRSTEQLLSSKFTSLTRSLEELRTSQDLSRENELSAKSSADMRLLELEVQRLSDQLTNERRRVADVERSLAASEKRLDEYASRESLKHAEHMEQEKALQSKIEKKKAIIQELAEQKRELEKNVSELYGELNASLTENESLRKQLAAVESSQSKVDNSQLAMANAKLEMERERTLELERQVAALRTGSTSSVAELEELRRSNEELVRQARESHRSVAGVQEELDRERDICLALTNDYREQEAEVKRLRQRIIKLNDSIVELKGSIMVFCRVRPLGQHEIEDMDLAQTDIDRLVHYPDYNLIDFKQTSFEFDRVFSPASTQEPIYDEVEPFVRSALNGYRVCIFAYGQTSSGKTHTMEGPEHDRGVNLRALSTIIHQSEVDDKYTTTVSMSMLEVYNEKIRDLLTSEGETVDLDVRVGKLGTYVDGLSEWPIRNMEDALATIARGAANRMVASNHVNEHSSRSHLVSLIKIDRRHIQSGDSSCGYLYLVDLAGSERIKQTAATGQRLKEAQNINRSLSSLGDVIAALASGQKHIPYRNSKLTFLLQDALRENSKVLMFVNINPNPNYTGESLCSLQFASRCRSVSFGQAKKMTTAPSGGK